MSVDPELERVRHESRHCRTCHGSGLVTVYHPDWTGSPASLVSTGEIIAGEEVHRLRTMEATGYCCCTLGRWMWGRVDAKIRRSIPDVAAILSGRSKWLLEPPAEAEAQRHAQFTSRFFASRLKAIGSVPADVLPFKPRKAV